MHLRFRRSNNVEGAIVARRITPSVIAISYGNILQSSSGCSRHATLKSPTTVSIGRKRSNSHRVSVGASIFGRLSISAVVG